jgi:hypothetical protein
MCGSLVLPHLLGELEHVGLAALVAPRPLLVQTGTEELVFSLAAATAAVATLRVVYEHLDAAITSFTTFSTATTSGANRNRPRSRLLAPRLAGLTGGGDTGTRSLAR